MNDDVTIAGGAKGALLAGRYRVVRQLGTGGMGTVWLVEDTLLDSKQFAIKMLPSILVANKRAYRQLKDEALVAMKLVHPNIVQLRAFEENDGNPFLVMDYIDGETLDDCLADKGRLSEDGTIRILKPIAAALDYAHSKGVVHRDVKPGNVMIAKDGTPVLLDFGIASENGGGRHEEDAPSGTRRYMAPERLAGAAPSPAQDVYSFAATVRECLRGDMPQGVAAALSRNPADRPATCMEVFETVPDTDSRSAASGGFWKVLALLAFVVALAVAVSSWLQSGGVRPPEAPEKAGQDGSKPAETNTKDVATNTPPIPPLVETNAPGAARGEAPKPVGGGATGAPPGRPSTKTNITDGVSNGTSGATNTTDGPTTGTVTPPVDEEAKHKADNAKNDALQAREPVEKQIDFPIVPGSELDDWWHAATNRVATANIKYLQGKYDAAADDYLAAIEQFKKIEEKLKERKK